MLEELCVTVLRSMESSGQSTMPPRAARTCYPVHTAHFYLNFVAASLPPSAYADTIAPVDSFYNNNLV
jgi:hypothetical protein